MELYTAVIDRPMGTAPPRHPDMIYPVNYGYIPGLNHRADGLVRDTMGPGWSNGGQGRQVQGPGGPGRNVPNGYGQPGWGR